MYSYFQLKTLSTVLVLVLFQNISNAHEITFLKSQNSATEPQILIVSTLEKYCISAYGKALLLTEVLNKNYCDYENKWCENKGFSTLDTENDQTIVVQYTEHWGIFKIDSILSNSDAIICNKLESL